MASRREFLAHSLTAATFAALPAAVFASTGRATRPLKLLVLGGTGSSVRTSSNARMHAGTR